MNGFHGKKKKFVKIVLLVKSKSKNCLPEKFRSGTVTVTTYYTNIILIFVFFFV